MFSRTRGSGSLAKAFSARNVLSREAAAEPEIGEVEGGRLRSPWSAHGRPKRFGVGSISAAMLGGIIWFMKSPRFGTL